MILPGMIFGHLTVVKNATARDPRNKPKGYPRAPTTPVYECSCACGYTAYVQERNLLAGTRSCGRGSHSSLDRRDCSIPVGAVIGHLTVGARISRPREHSQYQNIQKAYLSHGSLRECKCVCGNTKIVSEFALLQGSAKACGCGKGGRGALPIKVPWEATPRFMTDLWNENHKRIRDEKIYLTQMNQSPFTNRHKIEESQKYMAELLQRREHLRKIREPGTGQLTDDED